MGAVITSAEISSKLGAYFSTFGGNPVSSAIGKVLFYLRWVGLYDGNHVLSFYYLFFGVICDFFWVKLSDSIFFLLPLFLLIWHKNTSIFPPPPKNTNLSYPCLLHFLCGFKICIKFVGISVLEILKNEKLMTSARMVGKYLSSEFKKLVDR